MHNLEFVALSYILFDNDKVENTKDQCGNDQRGMPKQNAIQQEQNNRDGCQSIENACATIGLVNPEKTINDQQ